MMSRVLKSGLVLFFLASLINPVYALVLPTFASANGPTLLAGGSADLTIGAKYIYQDVETSTDGVVIDAIVTIVDINNSVIVGATIDNLLGVDDRFEPLVNTSAADGYVEWQVEFVQDGSVTNAMDVGVRAYLDDFTLEAIDVDGREFFEVVVTNSYTLEGGNSPATDLTVSANGGFTRFQSGPDSANGISVANTEYIVRVNYENVNLIKFRNGSSINSSDRQNSMSFLGEVTFDVEDTTVVNVAPTVVSQTGNEININATFNSNILTGSMDVDGNLVHSSVILIDATDVTNQGSVGNPLLIPGVGTYTVDATGNLVFTPVIDFSGTANILFSVSDSLGVSSDRATLELSVTDLTAPVVTIDTAITATLDNQNAYPVSGTCTIGDGDVTVTVTGASPQSQSVSCDASGLWSASFDVSPIADGNNVINVSASQTDAAGNTGEAVPVAADKDASVPVVAITSAPTANLDNQAAYSVSGSCSAGDGDVTVSIVGATPSSQAVSCDVDGLWSATFDVSAIVDGSNVIDINASQTDAAGNTGNATLVEADKDTSAPVVVISSAPTATLDNQAAYPVSGSCSVGDGDVTVSIVGATPSSQAVSCDVDGLWSATFDVSAIADGSNVVDINASQTDAAGNIGNAILVEADKDTVSVLVSILNAPASTTGMFNVTFEFSSDVTGFEVGDITVGNGAAGNFVALDGNTYSADVTPDGSGDITIDVSENVAQDSNSTGNSAATQVVVLLISDLDNDGIPDDVECPSGPPFDSGCVDTDGDGFPDNQDLDSDNDGIPDQVEAAGNLNDPVDSDQDGVENYIDLDSDNDGIPDHIEAGADFNNPVDTDQDGLPDYLDLDSDNDGIPDAIEGGSSGVDSDGDGVDDSFDVDQTGGADANADGIDDNAVIDTDADGIPDFRDVDSDNDGIPDAIEGGASGNDADGDGIDDAYDVDQTGGTDANGDGIDDDAIVDTDQDGIPDSQDFDSDNDGLPDALDDGATVDSDADGIPNILENSISGVDSDSDGIDDTLDVDQTGGLDANADGIDDFVIDRDGDGVPNYLDLDSDNDGIPDAFESASSGQDNNNNSIDDAFDVALVGGNDANLDGIVDDLLDTDSDAVADMFDLDADADGINDLQESGLTPAQIATLDADNNAVIEAAVGSNGLADAIETEDTIAALLDQDGNGQADEPMDTDSDTHYDFQDLDSDNDDIHDLLEGSGLDRAVVDTNMDGVIDDNGSDADLDGLSDLVDNDQGAFGGLPNNPADTDVDLVADFRDLDSDSDGISDLFEGSVFDPAIVDADNDGKLDNPLTDSDNDGIPDTGDSTAGYGDAQPVDTPDTDGDGVADFRDLDSDNDSVPDVIEAGNQDDNADGVLDAAGIVNFPPLDADADLTPNFRDLDSNDDGVFDIEDAGNAGLDANNDGVLDDMTDIDGDGIADVVDGDTTAFGLKLDTDNDGIIDSLDLDDDNDGIPDTAEKDTNGNDVDTDGDGLMDRLDLDSDSDGLPDSVEATQSVLDADADGLLDDFIDANDDGLHDAVDSAMIPLDTDADMTPDFRDLDSDDDGLTDNFEANGLSPSLDMNDDGLVDTLDDIDADGLPDVVDPEVSQGSAGTALSNPDSDGDHQSNYRDTDSDNDGLNDADEMVDANGDGIWDGLQEGDGLETAVRGTGSFSLLSGLMLIVLLLLRSVKNRFSMSLAAVLVVMSNLYSSTLVASASNDGDINYCGRHNPVDSDDDETFKNCFYAGASWLPVTHVDPEGSAFGWSTSDDSDAGYNLFLGWHFKPQWFAELSYADLGEAGLSNSHPSINGTEKIEYKIPALHAGYYLWEAESRFNVYGKLGISAIRNKATTPNVPFDKQNSVGLSGGFGVQWRSMDNGLFARLGMDLYDRDAHSLGVSLGYYFGESEAVRKPVKEKDSDADGVLDSVDSCPDSAAGEKVDSSGCKIVVVETVEPVKQELDSDADGVLDKMDACPDSAKGVQVDERGCVKLAIAELNVSLEGVHFNTNSAELTTDSTIILDKAVKALKASPLINVEVQAHTDNRGSETYNQDLSERRAASVRDYLVSHGIQAQRLTSRGYGEALPKYSNDTRLGRAKNRRVEFKIIESKVK